MERVGCSDENIFPAYFEDWDYMRRLRTLGTPEVWCPDTSVRHGGSVSLTASDEDRDHILMAFAANEAYFRRKWGVEGPTTVENATYARPFNNPAFGLRIAPEHRHAPYEPGYDRAD